MLDRGERDFFINKKGEAAVLTRRPNQRWYRAVTFRDLREWLSACGQPAELIWSQFREPFYEGDGRRIYELCMGYCLIPFSVNG